MRTFALATLAVAVSAHNEAEFMRHIAKFNLSYGTQEEYSFRLARFLEVDAEIALFNATETSVHAHNKFSTWTSTEYKRVLGRVAGLNSFDNSATHVVEGENADSIDWRQLGGVTPVKDQGQCGSCWAFSSTGALEGAHFVATGDLLSLSEQNLVDCAKGVKYLNFGCNGGLQQRAFKYTESHPLELEADYPYTALDGSCVYNKDNGVVGATDYVMVESANVDAFKSALNKQPVSVSIEADKLVFQTYKSGIFSSSKCGTTLDHAVLAVGYGYESGQGYWIVKNSWNTTWGENGYIKMAMVENSVGTCGVQSSPLYPVV